MGGSRRYGPSGSPLVPQLSSEQTLLPMLYLLLKRDLQRISLARKHVLSDSELYDAVDTIEAITLAARYRITDLRGEKYPRYLPPRFTWPQAIFEQQNLSPKEQFT